ncbi:hypothetical protein PN480_07245 [Dolichospermum circinale CS-1225]|uniref:SPOR domain-containing protein n=1 Tax=Dolichospermum circinale CS-537/01 TaxID=3021739 RepID=A0ABT5A505_9CYAN|nr:hypothetical protein [Dolichospermum circinale]MDB9467874.1 hypothetical protein [Dolichospermum circinale CS-539/09]MDB9470895.1 hypothetical protein [Dolichospermum circinale CS-539]MDB9486619.1 hypothetical protein [Dolichospermum circinale CS-537/01]MDB9521747.1 hypothetical protein [Dolichospermum circinale CS-1225]
MSNLRVSYFTPLSMLSLLVGGYWALISDYTPVQAQIPKNSQFLAQGTQQVQPGELNQYNRNFERYFVYVDSSDLQILQRVQQVESNAYIRNYNGRNVIQCGVFHQQSNAEIRVSELELNGVFGARIVNSANLEIKPNNSGQQTAYDNNQNNPNNYQQEARKYYYIVIPSHPNNLRSFGTEIRQKISANINVFMRTQPRGAHIAIGPFSDKSEAEIWNSYFQNSGYGNARVYYGK